MNDIRIGTLLKVDNQPYVCLWSDFMRTAQRKPVRRTKLKNLVSGNVLEKTFKPGDKVEEADVSRSRASYLYSDEDNAYFMDSGSYEQVSLPKDMVASSIHFMKEGEDYDLVSFEEKPITIDLPKKVELQVASTGDAIRGDTAQGAVTKDATLETGYTLKVPQFIKENDTIRVNTDTGEYTERV